MTVSSVPSLRYKAPSVYANTTDNQAEVHIKPAQQSKTNTVTSAQ